MSDRSTDKGPDRGTDRGKIGLGAQGLREVFPFFFAIDRELRLVDFGRSLGKICSGVRVGASLLSLVAVARPRLTPSFESFLRARAHTFFFAPLHQPVRLRGQMYYDAESDILLFLGSPWFSDLAELQNADLVPADFTLHDPIVDVLHMVQAQSAALSDAQKMSETVRQQRDELAAVNSQLEQAMAAKSQFLANTSHELRTPLNGIIGMASLLMRMKLSSQQRHYAETILKSGRTLLTVVNDILDISKIEAGRMTLEQIDFNLHRLISETIDGIAVTAQNRGLELVYVIDKALPTSLQGDPTRLAQVLNNLLGNAVKFTHKGEVVTRISRIPAPDSEIGLRIEVRDTGIGIAKEELDRIFRPFSQADTSMSRRFGGTGLGLSLCREIASLMGGEIGVNSIEGVGSTFFFTARLRPSRRVMTPFIGIAENFLDKRRVLLADDNASNREYVQELIRQWGGVCDCVDSAVLAIEALRAALAEDRPYDLLISDMIMPGMSGMELVAVLAGDALFDDLLLVMLSTLDPSTRKQYPQRKRINAHLTKPVHPPALRDCLSELLRARSAKASVLPSSYADESGDAVVPIEFRPEPAVAEPRVLVVDDNPVNLEVAAQMLETLGYRADMTTNGAEALKAMEHKPYALLLMDLQMPVMSGYEATAAVRIAEGTGKHTPIIAMTAHAMSADRQRALDAGMDDYISKPLEIDTLAELMQKWLPGGAGPAGPIPPPPSTVAAFDDVGETLDRSALDQLRRFQTPGGEDLVSKVVRTFLADLGERTQAARAAAAQRDTRTLGRIAHALKSSSKLVGARALSALCAELESAAELGDRTGLYALVERFLLHSAHVHAALTGLLNTGSPGISVSPGMNERSDRFIAPTLLPEERSTTRSQFFAELLHEAAAHPVLHHPLLTRLQSDPMSLEQLAVLGIQHFLYARSLGRDLGAVLSNVADEEIRNVLITTMHEELGESRRDPERIPSQLLRARRITAEQLASAYAELAASDSDGDVVSILLRRGDLSPEVLGDFQAMAAQRMREQSRPALFRNLLRTFGVLPGELVNHEPSTETAACIDEYHQLCRSTSWQEALGAVAVRAEWLLPRLYPALLRAIEGSRIGRREDFTYFTLQIEQAESLGARVVAALTPYADSAGNRRRIAVGIRRALELRKSFYDGLVRQVFRRGGY